MSDGTVVVVGAEAAADALADAPWDLHSVDSVEDAVGSLDASTAAAVVALDAPGGGASTFAERAAEAAPLLPVIVVGSSSRDAAAAELLGTGVEEYVDVSTADADAGIRSAVEAAIGDHRDRRDRVRTTMELPDETVVFRDGVVAASSAGVEALLGVGLEPGDPPSALTGEEDADALAAAVEAVGAAPETLEFAPAGDRHRTIEARLRFTDDDAVQARLTDVTDRANRVARFAEAADQLDALLQNIPMSIYFKDARGRHERVSDYITHTDPEDYIMNDEGKVHPHADDVIGKTDFDLYAPSFAAETWEDDMSVIEDEERIVNRIESGTTSLGEPLYTSTTKVPRYDEEGNVVGLVGVTIDVTERVTHREELERQNDRLNEFAEVLTHDLRNPLNIAQGYLDILEEGYDETAVEESAMALDRVESLIEEIRAFVLEGRVVDEPEAVDLRAAATEAWSTVDTGAATIEIEGDLRLRADRARLRRMLENLFRNAIEHGAPRAVAGAPGGEAEQERGAGLTIRVVAGRNEFAVEDDGVGMPDDVAPEDVFERGFTTSDEGTGFGLAIVESIAEAHGWSIDVCEGDSGGARFEFDNVVRAEAALGTTIAD